MKYTWRVEQAAFHPRPKRGGSLAARKVIISAGGLCVVGIMLSGVALVGYRTPDAAKAATARSVPPARATTPDAPSAGTTGAEAKAARILPPGTTADASARPSDAAAETADPAPNSPAPKALTAAMMAPMPTTSLAAPLPSAGAPSTAYFPDNPATASIAAASPAAVHVQVAENPAEVAKLEVTTGMVQDPAPPAGVADGASSADSKNVPDKPLPPMKPAKITKYVKLHAGPADEARVVAVLPANADIKAEAGCQWCTVVYNGQRGYVYKSFIRRSLKELADEGTGLF